MNLIAVGIVVTLVGIGMMIAWWQKKTKWDQGIADTPRNVGMAALSGGNVWDAMAQTLGKKKPAPTMLVVGACCSVIGGILIVISLFNR